MSDGNFFWLESRKGLRLKMRSLLHQGPFERCAGNFDKIRIIRGQNGLVNFDILRIFENWEANHNVVILLFIVHFWVFSCIEIVIFIKYLQFLVNRRAEEGGNTPQYHIFLRNRGQFTQSCSGPLYVAFRFVHAIKWSFRVSFM